MIDGMMECLYICEIRCIIEEEEEESTLVGKVVGKVPKVRQLGGR